MKKERKKKAKGRAWAGHGQEFDKFDNFDNFNNSISTTISKMNVCSFFLRDSAIRNVNEIRLVHFLHFYFYVSRWKKCRLFFFEIFRPYQAEGPSDIPSAPEL